MNDVILFIKTKSFLNDRRTHKEISLLKEIGKNVEVILSCDDDIELRNYDYKIRRINIPGGAANSNFIIRMFGAIYFSILSVILSNKGKGKTYWVADPIMFILVIMLSFFKGRIVWDHHELPPSWIFNNKLLKLLFRTAYKRCFLIVHTNRERQKKLEEWLGNSFIARSVVMKNLPDRSGVNSVEEVEGVEEWIRGREFIYLQNSFVSARCGANIYKAALENDLLIVHAGNSLDYDYLFKEGIDEDEFKKNVFLCGNLELKQINYLLQRCKMTVVFYKETSLNQVYCEPNRVYQAMANNSYILSGCNPTLVDILSIYPNCHILDSDGSILNDVSTAMKCKFNKKKYNYEEFWCKYKATLKNELI
ncbi:hypothetical protein ACF8FL_15120 [Vibrio sp. zbq_19]|uniref:hypothetical protein n=1 Tax=unclassified Vibrio TaxID=2614977 RepID=UPI0021CF0DCF|nr:hypothetical protein [Vibrio sp. Vb1755]MDW1832295.1 hypothetical protein [Vibrio sp. Vb1755]